MTRNRSAALSFVLFSAFTLMTACSSSSTPGSGGDGTSSGGSSSGGSSSGGNGSSSGAGNASSSGGSGSGSGSGSSSGGSSGGTSSGSADGGAVACDAGSCASVQGNVKRVAATKPTHGGKGSVYVAIFDGNPISNSSAAMVGRALLSNQDMNADTAQVAYRIDGVPVRTQAYQVIAFLDDANAVTAANPKPASGDLVSLNLSGGFGGMPLTAASQGVVTLDLDLNVAMP